jgi:colanic acid/amylovoran biosynthesis glycosyltransferase
MFPSVSETFVTNQIIGAKTQGYSVCILTYKLGTLEESSQHSLIEKYQLLKDTIVVDYKIPKAKYKRLFVGLYHIIRNFNYWYNPAEVSLRHRILNWPFLIKFYEKFRYVDVFHVQFAMGGLRIAEMKKTGLLKAKLIITFHGHDAHFKNEKVFIKLKTSYKILFEVSDFITVNTPYLGTKVLSLGCNPEKLCIIPMAVDVEFFSTEIKKAFPIHSDTQLISVGRLIDFKGFKYAIDAVRLLVDNNIYVHYTIVGEGHLYSPLQDQIQALKLNGHVTLVGKKTQDEIKQILQTHHIYLMSSITDVNGRCETQGVVSAEAQAMGLPVIAFNNGGIPYTIRDEETGILVKEKDIRAFAQAILELINDPGRYLFMSQQARELASSEFSSKLMSKRFMKLYEN